MKALISVFDKKEIKKLADILYSQGYKIYATDGTRKTIGEKALPIKFLTKNPDYIDSYLSALSLNTIIGLTAYNPQDITNYKDLMIDILICNFTPPDYDNFNIGNVDLGGPTLIRASILKPDLPYILTDPDQYKHFPDIFSASEKEVKDFKKQLTIMALKKCQEYDKMLLEYFQYSMVSSI